ncbi:hypothetical protein QTP88_005148 [Uroleucon formosanum]
MTGFLLIARPSFRFLFCFVSFFFVVVSPPWFFFLYALRTTAFHLILLILKTAIARCRNIILLDILTHAQIVTTHGDYRINTTLSVFVCTKFAGCVEIDHSVRARGVGRSQIPMRCTNVLCAASYSQTSAPYDTLLLQCDGLHETSMTATPLSSAFATITLYSCLDWLHKIAKVSIVQYNC